MIKLFNINNYEINTYSYKSLLHDRNVSQLEYKISGFVGAKYGLALNSATNAIFLSLLDKNTTVSIPSIIPPVVPNAIITSGNTVKFNDNVQWVGHSYILHQFDGDYKIVDSAQELTQNQFADNCNPDDLMIFSFYPTKPVGGCDGGMIVSDDYDKISYLREMSMNGTTFSNNTWERTINRVGYKMYMNSIQAEIITHNFYQYKSKLERLYSVRQYYNEKLNYNNTSNHLYRINVLDNAKFVSYMSEQGVQCGIHYKALHSNPIFGTEDISLPQSEHESQTTVSIPYHEQLTLSELQKITELILRYDEHS